MRLRSVLFVGALGLVLFELANVYFIMPLPGSQRIQSLQIAYAIYQWRWPVRALGCVLVLAGLRDAWRAGRGWRIGGGLAIAAAAAVAYGANFVMAADQMFKPPRSLILKPAAQNQVPGDRLVVAVDLDGEARAYPIRFVGYHHQVRDTVAGRELLVTYCTVCRTGRVFSPLVDGKSERFRLVGMDNWNAMFEDATTGSWWRQATGAAVAGSRAGARLTVIPSQQTTLHEWLELHPASLVMQADPAFADAYAKDDVYEKGTSRKTLTGTDPDSWKEKSWVVGVSLGGSSKAYDWNRLRRERVINDAVGKTPIVLVLAADGASFFAFERPDVETVFELREESLVSSFGTYTLWGTSSSGSLKPIAASQEFWHSWRTFHPDTQRY